VKLIARSSVTLLALLVLSPAVHAQQQALPQHACPEVNRPTDGAEPCGPAVRDPYSRLNLDLAISTAPRTFEIGLSGTNLGHNEVGRFTVHRSLRGEGSLEIRSVLLNGTVPGTAGGPAFDLGIVALNRMRARDSSSIRGLLSINAGLALYENLTAERVGVFSFGAQFDRFMTSPTPGQTAGFREVRHRREGVFVRFLVADPTTWLELQCTWHSYSHARARQEQRVRLEDGTEADVLRSSRLRVGNGSSCRGIAERAFVPQTLFGFLDIRSDYDERPTPSPSEWALVPAPYRVNWMVQVGVRLVVLEPLFGPPRPVE
jgi:hypothetical protein